MSLLQRLFGGQTVQPAPSDTLREDLRDVEKATKPADSDEAKMVKVQKAEEEGDDMLDVEKLLQRLIDEDEHPAASQKEEGEKEEEEQSERQVPRIVKVETKEEDNEYDENDQNLLLKSLLEAEGEEEEEEEEEEVLFPSDFDNSDNDDDDNGDDDGEEEYESVASLTKTDSRPQHVLVVDSLSLTLPLETLYRRYERARLRYEAIEKAKLSAIDRAVAERAEALREKTIELQTQMAAIEQQVSDVWTSMEGSRARKQLDYLYPVVGDDSKYTKLLQRRSVAESLRFQSLLEQLALNLQASASGEPYTLDKAAAAAIGFVELPERDQNERTQAIEFRDTLQRYIERVNETEQAYQRQTRRAQQLQSQHLREKRSYELAKEAIRRALETDGAADDYARLPALAAALKEYGDLRQTIRESYRELDVARANVERETAARELLTYVRQAQVRTLRQVERELRKSVETRLAELTDRESAERRVIETTLDELTENRRAVERAMQNYLTETNKQAADAQERFDTAKKAYLDALEDLEERAEEVRADSRWPAALDVDDFERKVQSALEEAGVERLDELQESDALTDPEKCKRPPQGVAPVPTEFQKAAAELVSGEFEALPGALLFWDTGAGKTFGGSLAIVRSIEYQATQNDNDNDSGQAVVVGFSETNLRSFYETIDSILRTRYGNRYQPSPLSGGRFSDRSSSATHFEYTISGKGKENPAFDGSVTFVRMHLSPKTHLRGAHSVRPDALIVVDEVHYLTGAPPRKGAAPANPQTLEKWQRLVKTHAGKRLLLSATPAAKEDDPNSLLQTLSLIPRKSRPENAEQTIDARQWFVQDDADGSTRWVSEEARKQFERDWVRGVVSHASLRFDQTVFPAVDTDCGDPKNRACVYRFDRATLKTALLPEEERPLLNMFEMDARSKKDYKNLVPTVVHVPLNAPSAKALLGRRRQQPGLVDCVTSSETIASGELKEEACAEFAKGYTSADEKVHGYKTTSGGGFDAPEKALALRAQLDAYTNKKHLVVAMMNPNVQSGWTNKPLRAALDSNLAQFERARLWPADIRKLHREHADGSLNTLFDSLEPQRRYLDVTGSALDGAEKTFAMRVFNHPANATGRFFEVLVIDGKMLAGTDVPGAHMTHLLSPPHDLKSQKQAYGRILRLCALAAYAQSGVDGARDPTVRVLTYVSTVDRSMKQIRVTPDQLLMQWLGTQRRTLSAVDLMYEQMRLAAVDRYFFGDYSTGGRWKRASSLEKAEEATTHEEIGRPKESMDALDYLLFTLLKEEQREPGAKEATQNEKEGGERFTVDAAREFAERFYQPRPWSTYAALPESRSSSLLVDDATGVDQPSFTVGKKTYDALRKIAQANRLPDLALLASYLAALPSSDKTSLSLYLTEKQRITAPGPLEIFSARADLMRKAELKRMNLVNAWLSSATQISNAAKTLTEAELHP